MKILILLPQGNSESGGINDLENLSLILKKYSFEVVVARIPFDCSVNSVFALFKLFFLKLDGNYHVIMPEIMVPFIGLKDLGANGYSICCLNPFYIFDNTSSRGSEEIMKTMWGAKKIFVAPGDSFHLLSEVCKGFPTDNLVPILFGEIFSEDSLDASEIFHARNKNFREIRDPSNILRIGYMPRKRGLTAKRILRLIKELFRNEGRVVELVEIDGIPNSEVLRRLAKCNCFFATSETEGIGLPIVEAWRQGCLVFGFSGGVDSLLSGMFISSPTENVIAVKRALEHEMEIERSETVESISRRARSLSEFFIEKKIAEFSFTTAQFFNKSILLRICLARYSCGFKKWIRRG